MSIRENWARIKERVAEAALRVGRSPEEIQILGAAKGQPPSKIREAFEAGLRIVGENYVQEAQKKKEALSDLPLSWHLIGYLQKNKARKALEIFQVIETVDRLEIAEKLSQGAQKLQKEVPVFIEVNIGEEPTKKGVPPSELPALLRRLLALPGLKPRGLMAIPPYKKDPEAVRPYFRALREWRDRLQEEFSLPDFTELSMGMSQDFEVAVEEGATLVRIGTALFGPRPR